MIDELVTEESKKIEQPHNAGNQQKKTTKGKVTKTQ